MRRLNAMIYEVTKTVETRGGCVYKVAKVQTIRVRLGLSDEQKTAIANSLGGDSMGPTTGLLVDIEAGVDWEAD